MRVIRYIGPRNRLAPGYKNELESVPAAAIIDTVVGKPNVALHFERDGKPLQTTLRDDVRDFLDLAVTVYIADELNGREHSDDRWTRRFDVVFPVKRPDLWATVAGILGETLNTLSGDEFNFSWMPRPALPSLGRHRRFVPRGFDVVCLFSGGLDSLLGAHHLLSQGKKVLLVGHQAEGITASTQTAIANELKRRFPGSVSLIQCRVARSLVRRPRYSLPEKEEITHRSRSFLFLAIAVAIASVRDIQEIVIPENGLISINAPLQTSRLGTLSTRTAHPKYLVQFQELVNRLGVFPGKISNPFLYLSKTDMLADMDPVLADLAIRTVSCAHAGDLRWRGTSLKHCGYCVPCIYRRIGMMSAGIDQASHYIDNVFTQLPSLTKTKQADFRALVSFARRIVSCSEAERQMIILSHGAFAPEEASAIGPAPTADFSPWSSMLLRWASDFLDKVATHGSDETKRMLGV